MKHGDPTKQFHYRKIEIAGKSCKAVRGYSATLMLNGREIMITAPNIESLRSVWNMFCTRRLDEKLVRDTATMHETVLDKLLNVIA